MPYINPHARDCVNAVLAELLIGQDRKRTLGTIGRVSIVFRTGEEGLLAIVSHENGDEMGRFVIRARGI